MGFSIEELRHLTVAEVVTFADLAYPETEPESKVRKATQADIDRLAH